MTYTLVGFPKEDKQPMKAAFDMMAKGSQRACQALMKGDLSAYNVFFETKGTQHLMKVASVGKDIDDTIRNKKVTFVYAGARAHRRQQHVCIPSVIGVMVVALTRMAAAVVPDPFAIIVLLATVAVPTLWHFAPVTAVLAGAVIGVVRNRICDLSAVRAVLCVTPWGR